MVLILGRFPLECFFVCLFRRNKNVITKVNNQKNCGACWAFSTAETIESMNAIKNGKLDQLSVQELIDCARYNNDGCNGGDICTLLYWMLDNDISVQKEAAYPLHLRTETCKLKSRNNSLLTEVKIADFSCNRFVAALSIRNMYVFNIRILTAM